MPSDGDDDPAALICRPLARKTRPLQSRRVLFIWTRISKRAQAVGLRWAAFDSRGLIV